VFTVEYYAMNTHEKLEVQLHTFLVSAQDRCQYSSLRHST